MSSPYLAQIILFAGGNYVPKGWALCNGQVLQISSNQALFSLLSNRYGGDGRSTFALPDLRSRVPVHVGTGPGLSNNYTLGGTTGSETISLTSGQMPSHNHAANGNSSPGNTPSPANAIWAAGPVGSSGRSPTQYATGQSPTAMSANAIASAGAGAGHPNIQPFLALNYIIALTGIFPVRN